MAKRVGAGFYFLNVTQFLGAFNDNILKQVLMFGLLSGGVWSLYLGQGGQAWASICLCIPFILFSGFAGQFSDKYSKRRISVVTKWSEIPIALFAMVGLWFSYLPIVMFALFAIALQSTFFSPAKFGILPEIIPDNKLSRANGTMNMFTWFSIILGCALGGVVYDGYAADRSNPFKWTPRLWWMKGLTNFWFRQTRYLSSRQGSIEFSVSQSTWRSAVLESRSEVFFAEFSKRDNKLTIELSRPAFNETIRFHASMA